MPTCVAFMACLVEGLDGACSAVGTSDCSRAWLTDAGMCTLQALTWTVGLCYISPSPLLAGFLDNEIGHHYKTNH